MDERAAIPEGLVYTAAQARVRGTEPHALGRLVRAGRVVRIRRDAYVDAATWNGLPQREQHVLRMVAAERSLAAPVFSHWSAAAVHDLPLLGSWPEDVHVTGPFATGGRSQAHVVRHCTGAPVSTTVVGGLTLTSVPRTVVDLARTRPLASALMAADAALHRRLVTRDELARELDALRYPRGLVAARAALDQASPLSGSPGESASRATMIELGIPLPQLQKEWVVDGRVYRTDFWWEEFNLVGEFDGRLKYRVHGLPDGRAVEERVWDEKLREDALRSIGPRVARWTWAEAVDPLRLGRILARHGVLPGLAVAPRSRPHRLAVAG